MGDFLDFPDLDQLQESLRRELVLRRSGNCCSLFLSLRTEYPFLLWTPTFMIAALISWTLKVFTSSFPMERRTTVCVGVHSVEPVHACCRGGVHALASLS